MVPETSEDSSKATTRAQCTNVSAQGTRRSQAWMARRTRTAITASTLRSGQASLPARPANRPFVKTATRVTCERRPTSRGKPMRLELLGSVPSARRNAAVRSAGVTRTTCTASGTGASSRPSRARFCSSPPRACNGVHGVACRRYLGSRRRRGLSESAQAHARMHHPRLCSICDNICMRASCIHARIM